ncbi:hypothetical protein FE243_02245 [Aliarcobacter thereius]|uniref:LicD family protein n=1 Tax=Aliarcobacter thereius TaxID=544718 RepID=UPI0010FCF5D7|nr:LicD family protein [Aliarcobacter thereius]TLT08742.1 hypothetical protein FE243_02245 [Aliarcobacter thereius]
MKNILLFGTGDGAKKYLLKNGANLRIIAAFDNDIKKHGTFFEDIRIYSPKEINNFDFDEIVIVSQWAKDIYEQLINELKIDKNKIYIPAKKEIKEASRPFEDDKTRELARRIITHISKSAIENNIPIMVDFGTLLGIVRDKDVIKWDDDVDFSITEEALNIDFSLWLKDIMNEMDSTINFKIRTKIIENKNVSYILELEDNLNEIRFRNFTTSISLRHNIGKYSKHLPSGGMWYAPKIHFDKYEIMDWLGQKIYTPYNYKEYLTFLYGDWKTPKKDITMADYANLGNVEYSDFMNLGIGYEEIK